MKITVCQLDPRTGFLEPNLAQLASHIKESRSQFLLLPEMCFSPWLAADPNPDAARWHQAVQDHQQHIAQLDRLGAEAVIGTRPVVLSNGSFRNQAYLWTSATGAVGVHEKYYLPNDESYWENNWYDRGERRFDLCRALDLRVGVQICTEMWFFEWARHFAAGKADLLCVPRATPHDTVSQWLAGGQAAAICSGAYCLSSALWTPPGDTADCSGLAWVISPDGQILAQTSEDDPFATLEVDVALARASKFTYPRYVPE